MLIYVLLVVFGLIFGSFIDALTWRIREQSLLLEKKKHAKIPRELSMLHGRSMCQSCKHVLGPLDLVPLFSWLFLRGKCHYCGAKISWQSPVIEVVMALLFAGSYALWPLALQGIGLMEFCFWLVFLVGFVALAVYDLRWYILPDRIVYPLIGLAVVQTLLTYFIYHTGWQSLVGSVWGVLIASGIFYVLYQVSDGSWIGGGDVKLGVVLGILLGGPMLSLLLLFVASVLGTLVSLPLLGFGKAKRSTLIPFGPFLIAATIIIELYGHQFVNWFTQFSG
jgi:prepilin signal peptidase PulO-like enzyme (type II secretory pathway)